jgi:hypothetical protein
MGGDGHLRHDTFAPLEDTTEEMKHILYAETTRMEDANSLDGAPMWRVAFLTTYGAVCAYVTVSTNHKITDG